MKDVKDMKRSLLFVLFFASSTVTVASPVRSRLCKRLAEKATTSFKDRFLNKKKMSSQFIQNGPWLGWTLYCLTKGTLYGTAIAGTGAAVAATGGGLAAGAGAVVSSMGIAGAGGATAGAAAAGISAGVTMAGAGALAAETTVATVAAAGSFAGAAAAVEGASLAAGAFGTSLWFLP